MSYAINNPDDPTVDPSQVDKATQTSGTAQAPTDSQATQPSVSSGGGTGVVSAGGGNVGGGASSASGGAPKPSSSGSWTNLQDYLSTNADQSGKVGSDIAGAVNSQANTAQSDLGNLNTGFNNSVNSATVNQDDAAVNGALTSATTTGSLTPAQTAAFQAQSNAAYSGPSSYSGQPNYGQTVSDFQNANTAVAQTQSEAGRNSLLQNQYKNSSANGYNQGENNLDQMLLENSPGAQQQLQPLASQWSGLNSALGNSATAGQAAIQNAQATDAATSQNAKGQLTSDQSTFENNLHQAVTNAQTQGQANYNDYQSNVAGGNHTFDASTLAGLGIQPNTRTYNLDLSSYLNPFSAGGISAQTLASPQQYAQYQALNQLAGTTPSELVNPSLAGTATTPGFNKVQLATDVGNKQKAYDTAYASQRSGVLNTGYLAQFGLNPNSAGGYADSIPGALTSRRDINTASPQELESFWLPLFQQASSMYGGNMYKAAASGIAQSVAAWKSNLGYNNVVQGQP